MTGLLLLLACGTASVDAPAVPTPRPPPRGPAVRLADGPVGPVLEVAGDRYRHPDGGELLVQGTVHVADPAFFAVSVARLEELDTVLVEGLVDDVEPQPPTASSTAAVLGLQHQGDVAIDRPGWSVRDLSESAIQARMQADGVDEVDIRALLVEEPGTSRADLPDDARGVALARLRYMRDLSVDETRPEVRRYLIELRDEHLVEGVRATGRQGIWYGAAHLPGLGLRLSEGGWSHEERTWTPAIATSYSELALGPVQVKQLIEGWSK